MNIHDLIGKDVTIYCINLKETEGILQSTTNDGVFIKTAATYELFPWNEVTCIQYDIPSNVVTKTSKTVNDIKFPELKITDSDSTIAIEKYNIAEKILPTNYTIDWEEENEEFLINDDNDDEAVRVNISDEQITVYYDKDFDFAKKLAKEIKIYNIERDYQNE